MRHLSGHFKEEGGDVSLHLQKRVSQERKNLNNLTFH